MAARKGGTDQARRNGGIEIIVEQEDPLEDHFKTLPNALLRGEVDDKYGFDFRGYTLRERALLAALVSNAKVYRCTRGRIEALAPELGPDGLDTVINGLKRKGHLRTARVNDPDNRGRFVWRWEVSLRPKYATAAGGIPDENAAPSMGGLDPHGRGPAQTIGVSATDGSAMDGSSGSKYLKDQGLEEPLPPPPSSVPVLTATAVEEEEAHPPTQIDQAMLVLADALTAAGARRSLPPPRAAELAQGLAAKLAAGWTGQDAVAALSDPLTGTQSVYAIMKWRVANLLDGPPPPPRPAPRQIPRRCGCLNGVILVPNPNDPRRDTPRPCPNCRPAETSAA